MASTATSSPDWGWNGIDKATLHGGRFGGVSHQSILLFSALRCWQHIKNLKADPKPLYQSRGTDMPYSVARETQDALNHLRQTCQNELPQVILELAKTVHITPGSGEGDKVHFPTPLKEQDAATAIKSLEACAAAAIANLRYGTETRRIQVDTNRISTFLMSAYLTTLDGMGKTNDKIKERLPETDLNQAQSILYRRLSANLYATKTPGEYYHIHGSLDADVTLGMLGLPSNIPEMTSYRECIDYIGAAVKKFTAKELDKLNLDHRQAGIQALTWDQFQATPHGKALTQLPPFTIRPNPGDISTPPVPFPLLPTTSPNTPRYALTGIRVLELCRIIAGPTIGRTLAAHGAHVIKVTSPHLPDVPFFQLDVNTGKHAIALDLKHNPAHRQTFETLLKEADVLIDGYRPGALARLGYSPSSLARIARERGKGFVYVAENCFGSSPDPDTELEWSSRPGWQQIADCVTGVAFAQGAFMGLASEPVVPPFPMSDYGTGALGALAALGGLYRRATEGGSWVCRTSLCQYDVFLMQLGLLPEGEQERLRGVFGGGEDGDGDGEEGFFGLRHCDSVDEVGRRALAGMKRVAPHLFDSEKMMHSAWSEGFQGVVRWPKEAVEVEGLRVGHVKTARPNGFDMIADVDAGWSGWEDWEEDEIGVSPEEAAI